MHWWAITSRPFSLGSEHASRFSFLFLVFPGRGGSYLGWRLCGWPGRAPASSLLLPTRRWGLGVKHCVGGRSSGRKPPPWVPASPVLPFPSAFADHSPHQLPGTNILSDHHRSCCCEVPTPSFLATPCLSPVCSGLARAPLPTTTWYPPDLLRISVEKTCLTSIRPSHPLTRKNLLSGGRSSDRPSP